MLSLIKVNQYFLISIVEVVITHKEVFALFTALNLNSGMVEIILSSAQVSYLIKCLKRVLRCYVATQGVLADTDGPHMQIVDLFNSFNTENVFF